MVCVICYMKLTFRKRVIKFCLTYTKYIDIYIPKNVVDRRKFVTYAIDI